MSDLWILAGQSNMEGCGDLVDVEPPHPNVQVFAQGDTWQQASEPLHWLLDSNDNVHARFCGLTLEEAKKTSLESRATRNKGAGCGLPFARVVADKTGRAIDLLAEAHGGTSMQQWSPELKGDGGDSLYGAMLRRTRLALETKPESKLKGVLWYQGESDCNPTDVPLYTQRMIALIESWRADLDAPDLPFFIVQLGNLFVPQIDQAGIESWTAIREAQRTLPSLVKNLTTIPAIDLGLDDGIHIGTQGLKRLGHRLANAALSSVYGQSAPTPLSVASIKAIAPRQVKVTYAGVTGALKAPDTEGRVPGFGLVGPDGVCNGAAFYKPLLAADDPHSVILSGDTDITSEIRLVYGYGFDTFCQLTDSADMAAPAFGPLGIE
jgi:sialate O-acetylesterase